MVLVTGITGLLGSHLAINLLENQNSVRGMYRNPENIQKTKRVFEYYKKQHLFDKIEWVQADILDITSLEIAFHNIKYVYHCAALISFDPKDENQLRKINVEGTANIVNFCLAKNIRKLCHVSSIAALGSALNNEIICENSIWNTEVKHSDYAISKYGAETEVWRGQQEGLATIIINPGVILAPLFWKTGSGEIFEKVKNGLAFYTTGSTGFVVITDVVAIAIKLMESNIESEKYILVSENQTYKDFIWSIAKALGTKKPTKKATKTITTIAYTTDWLLSKVLNKKRTLTKQMVKSLHEKDQYKNQKIITTLNYNFISIEEYINQICLKN